MLPTLKLNLHLCVFYLGHCLFYIELLNQLRGGGELRFAGVQGQDLALIGVLGYAFFWVSGFQQILRHRWSKAYLLFLGVFTVYGALYGHELGWIRTELRTLLWPYGGLALFLMLKSSRRPVWHLAVIMIALTGMMHLGKQQAIASFGQLTVGQDRFYSLQLMTVCISFLIYLGLLLNSFDGLKRHYWLTLPALLSFLYYGVIIAATRNIMMSFVLLLGLSAYRQWFYREGLRFSRVLLLGLLTLAVLPVALQSPAGQRLLDGDKADKKSTNLRWEEVVAVSEEYAPYELLFGKGVGTTFANAINPGNNVLHLGVFNLAAKFGLPVFFMFVFVIGLGLPLVALNRKAVFSASGLDRFLPYCYAWALIFFISGGWHPEYFMGLGLNLGYAANVKFNSLNTNEAV
jgi:hypothetical protein